MLFCQRFSQKLLWLLGAVFLVLLLMQPASLAQSINDWSSPRQQTAGWIRDRADLLPWYTEHHLNRRINKLAGRTSAELAIVTLPHLPAGQSAHEFALHLFNRWGIGNRDSNNGVLLLVSHADRRIEIITGTGLGQALPDAEVSRLIQQAIVPAFQRQDYATGIEQGTHAIAQRLEARLPSTIHPSWLPAATVGLPWLLAIGGIGLGLTGTVQAIAFSLTRVLVPVPTQGMDTTTFAHSSDQLAAYPLPNLLAKLFTPHDRPWQQEIPETPLSYVWVGGMLAGIGIIQGFWQFVLMHPEAEMWQSDTAAWGICASASSAGLLWGAAVTSRFVNRRRFWQILWLDLLVIALVALLGGYLWVYYVPNWWPVLLMMAVFLVVGWVVWRIIVAEDLQFKQQRDYRSDRTGNPIQELAAPDLERVLRPDEILAQAMGKLEFRGWRDGELPVPLTRNQVYLVRRSTPPVWSCQHCQSFAVELSERTVERTIETTKKINRKKKETVRSVIQVKQTVYTCHSCGFVDAYDQQAPAIASNGESNHFSSSSSSSSYSSSSSDQSSSYDNTSNYDYGSSSGSDFGGGSSDGGGAGSDW